MGKIDKNQMVYDTNGNAICLGKDFIEKGYKPVSKKYPGGNNFMSFVAAKGKHVGSHKPIKNHRGKIVKRS